jgi:hypothetical protein
MSETKLRSRAYPAVSLPEAVELLRRLAAAADFGRQDRERVYAALGHAGGKNGVAARKLSALGQFGLLAQNGGLYSATPLGDRLLEERDLQRLRALLREACRNPVLFQEIFVRYEPVGRVPWPLARALRLDHGIQENAQDEVAQIFMASARHAEILDGDGQFRLEYFDETRRPRPLARFQEPLPERQPAPGAESPGEAGESRDVQKLKFQLTEHKPAEIRVPVRLNELDIALLRLQIDYLEAQVRLNRPEQPDQGVKLDFPSGKRTS